MIRGLGRFVFTLAMSLTATAVLAAAPAHADAPPDKYASIVVDADTGRVMHAKNADELRYPASLTKMMTLYMLFDALEAGEVSLDDRMPISNHAAAQEPSKIYVKPGETLRVEDGVLALVTKSANDAAVVIAEYLGGTHEQFARMMTEKARDLGMTRTRFRNANGLPDPGQVTTARDLAILSDALFENHRDYYSYFAVESFTYKNATYRSHNRLLANLDGVEGVDGIKTGYTRASGFNLATSAERDGHRIVAVVLGGSTSRVRDAHMADLVENAFLSIEAETPTPMMVASLSETGEPMAFLKEPAEAIPPAVIREDVREQEQAIALASLELAAPAEQGDTDSGRGVRIVFSDDAGAPAPEEAASNVAPAAEPVVVRMPPEPDPSPEPEDQPALRTTLRAEEDSFGGWQIQVGAYRDEETALNRIAQLEAMSLAILSGKASHIENATVDQASWYRARFAGLDEASARQACAALTASGAGCFPVAPQ